MVMIPKIFMKTLIWTKIFKGDEMTYQNNIGFMEMIQFVQVANKDQQKQMDEIVKNEDWESYKKLIKKVLKIELI